MRAIDADALKADYGMKDDCEDCEKELKGYVKRCQYDAVYTKMDFCGWIDAMPTIEPESNWISCKERLPEKPDNYPHCGIYRTYFLVSLESGCVKSLAYEFERDEWQTTGSPVIAWQPLPESYKKEGDKDGR